MIESILVGIAATMPLEDASVVLGFTYSILAVKRSSSGRAVHRHAGHAPARHLALRAAQ